MLAAKVCELPLDPPLLRASGGKGADRHTDDEDNDDAERERAGPHVIFRSTSE